MTVSVDNALLFFSMQYSYVPVQTSTDKDAGANTGPKFLSYDHFTAYYNLATDEFAADLLNRGGIVATDNQVNAALAHLIADYCEMSNPDWSYRVQSVTVAPGLPEMRVERGPETSPRAAYNKLLDIIMKAGRHAPSAYNGTADVEPMFYRGIMQMPSGSSGMSVTDMREHSDWDY